MENTLISSLLKNINTITHQSFIENNISYYESKDDFFKDIYLKLLKELKKEYIKIINMAPQNICLSILSSGTRKGEKCGVKIKDNSNYCKKHKSKEEGPVVLPEEPVVLPEGPVVLPEEPVVLQKSNITSQPIDNSSHKTSNEYTEHSQLNSTTRYIIKKNMFDNFVFGNTPYIFKSATEKYIVARQGLNGEWIPLTEEDKQICRKKYHLRCRDLEQAEKPSVDMSFVQNNIKLPYEMNTHETSSNSSTSETFDKRNSAKKEKVHVEDDDEVQDEVTLSVKKKLPIQSQQKQISKKEKVKVQIEDDDEDQDEVTLGIKKKSPVKSHQKQVSKKEKIKVQIEDDDEDQDEVTLSVKKKSPVQSHQKQVSKKEKIKVQVEDDDE